LSRSISWWWRNPPRRRPAAYDGEEPSRWI